MGAEPGWDDDREDLGDLPFRKKESNSGLIIGLVIGGVVLLSFTCLIGVGIVAVFALLAPGAQQPAETKEAVEAHRSAEAVGTHPDEFVGSWRGRFVIKGRVADVVYTFDKSGSFLQQMTVQGRQGTSGGRWRVRDGHVEIDFSNGETEKAKAVFVNENTIHYSIVDQSDRTQIGMGTTFRRQ